MLDAGDQLSDKRTLLMKTHRLFEAQYKLFYGIPSALKNGEETTYYIISKMISNWSCLVYDRSSLVKKSNTLFNERRENLCKENIPAFNVQGKSSSVSVSPKKI